MLSDGGYVGGVIFGGHGYGAEEETGKGGMQIEDVTALGVDVEEIEGGWGGAGSPGKAGFDAAEEQLEGGSFKGVEEEGESRGAGEIKGEGVLLIETGRGEGRCGDVGGVGGEPVIEIELGGVGESGIEFDTDDLMEGKLAGDEHRAPFARADVDERVVGDGVGWGGGAPEVDEGAEDTGGDTVVGGDVGVVWMAGDEVAGGDEAAGVDAVNLVEGVLGWLRRGHDERSFGFAGRHVSADLHEARISGETEGFEPGGRDAEGRPCGFEKEGDGGVADGLETGEAVCDLGGELLVGGFVGAGGGEGDLDMVTIGNASDTEARAFDFRSDGD